MGSLRDVRDNRACFVWVLVDRRAVSQHEVSGSPFNLDGATGAPGCGAGGHWREDSVVRAGGNSATKAPKNKKGNLEMAYRDNSA
jgi:hypothetical protein